MKETILMALKHLYLIVDEDEDDGLSNLEIGLIVAGSLLMLLVVISISVAMCKSQKVDTATDAPAVSRNNTLNPPRNPPSHFNGYPTAFIPSVPVTPYQQAQKNNVQHHQHRGYHQQNYVSSNTQYSNSHYSSNPSAHFQARRQPTHMNSYYSPPNTAYQMHRAMANVRR